MSRTAAMAALIASGSPASGQQDARRSAVLVKIGATPGQFFVLNQTAYDVRLQPKVTVEGLRGGSWFSMLTELALVGACDADGVASPLVGCVSLEAHQTLSPPPWLGWSCNGQCEKHRRSNIYWGSGPFRLKVTECETGAAFVSEAFRMPEAPPGSQKAS